MATKATPRRLKIETATKARTKADLYRTLADNTDLTRRQISDVFDVLGAVVKKDLTKGGPGLVNVAGLMKISVQRKSPVPQRQGINPFTGQMTTFKAKPARNVVRVRPLKGLKDMVG